MRLDITDMNTHDYVEIRDGQTVRRYLDGNLIEENQ